MKTKKEAADFLGVSEKAIERYTKAGKLSKFLEPKEGGGFITYYEVDELEQIKKAMHSKEKKTPPGQSDTKTTALTRRSVSAPAIAALAQLFQNQGLSVPIESKPLLTLKECSAFTGLSRQTLTKAIKTRKLKASKDLGRGWKIKRKDLDTYIDKL